MSIEKSISSKNTFLKRIAYDLEVLFQCMIVPEYNDRRSELEFKILVRFEVPTVVLTKIPVF
jgi:hypothetical protein